MVPKWLQRLTIITNLFTVDLLFMEIQIGANADFLSAGAEASLNAGLIETKGKKKLSFGAKVGALLFGLGFDIGITVPA